MLYTELALFVHSGLQFDDSGWNRVGINFGTMLWPTSHVVGSTSTTSNTRRRLAPTTEIGIAELHRRDLSSPARCGFSPRGHDREISLKNGLGSANRNFDESSP